MKCGRFCNCKRHRHHRVPQCDARGNPPESPAGAPVATHEAVSLRCLCGDLRACAAHQVDVAEFLRLAVAAGWRLIDRDDGDIDVTRYWDDSIEIEMSGTCPDCSAKLRANLAARRAA